MFYIKKSDLPPGNWEALFSKHVADDGGPILRRSYVFDECINKSDVCKILLEEQNYLCAYCQRRLSNESASIEHLVPNSLNSEMSTLYYNVVAVCKDNKLASGENFCEPNRGNKLLPLLVLYKNVSSTETSTNAFYTCTSTGELIPRKDLDPSIKNQVQSFIEILNLNIEKLKEARKAAVNAKIVMPLSRRGTSREDKKKIQRIILKAGDIEFRECLLSFINGKLGIH
jgi:uncharacterized protein (TIGR02646 family)